MGAKTIKKEDDSNGVLLLFLAMIVVFTSIFYLIQNSGVTSDLTPGSCYKNVIYDNTYSKIISIEETPDITNIKYEIATKDDSDSVYTMVRLKRNFENRYDEMDCLIFERIKQDILFDKILERLDRLERRLNE